LKGDFFKRGAGHTHEAFARRGGQDCALGRRRNVALHKHIAVVSDNRRRALATTAKLWQRPVLPNDLLDCHRNLILSLFLIFSVNQNHVFWFTGIEGSECV